MPSRLQILTALVGTAFALPNLTPRDTSALRILPWSWNFNITALSGPGCPDFGATSPPHVTRPTFGSNTVDGSEIYYWFFAYPHLRASVGPGAPEASVWCETTLAYTELDKNGVAPAAPGYRLKLHKNGTQVIARYDLEDGVEAKLKFTYFTDGKETIVDTLNVAGPRASGSYNDNTPTTELVQWPLPKCGTGTIKFRTELTVSAKKEGAKGTVSSDQLEYEGKTVYYGLQQGVSYDWEKCTA